MAEDNSPSTRELIAEGEKLRGEKKSKRAAKTRQIVNDAEKLIGREGTSSGSTPMVLAILFVVALVAATVIYYFLL